MERLTMRELSDTVSWLQDGGDPFEDLGDEDDPLLRYEASLERSFYRALHELHRLQAARGGVPVPPPAALDVDVAVTTEP